MSDELVGKRPADSVESGLKRRAKAKSPALIAYKKALLDYDRAIYDFRHAPGDPGCPSSRLLYCGLFCAAADACGEVVTTAKCELAIETARRRVAAVEEGKGDPPTYEKATGIRSFEDEWYFRAVERAYKNEWRLRNIWKHHRPSDCEGWKNRQPAEDSIDAAARIVAFLQANERECL